MLLATGVKQVRYRRGPTRSNEALYAHVCECECVCVCVSELTTITILSMETHPLVSSAQ